MPITAPFVKVASVPKLALLVITMLSLTLMAVPVEASPAAPSQTSDPSLTEVFETRCNVEGPARTIPLHPEIGGSVPMLVKGTASVVRLDEPIPPGSYDVSYLSYDGYPGRESRSQGTEVWEIQFFSAESPDALLGTVGPTKDLADFVTEAFEFSWPADATSTITTDVETTVLAIKHAALPDAIGPNSVRPICLNLFPSDQDKPIPIVPDNACGGADLVFRNPHVAYDSSFYKLWKHATSFPLAEIDPPLRGSSTYRLIAASFDGYDLRPGSTWEKDEVWVAEFWSPDNRLVATSAPTQDLPDGPGHTEATWEGPLGTVTFDEPVARVTVRHAASSDRAPNSVYAVCLGISWVEEPSLEEILELKDYPNTEPARQTTFAPGGYELEILAEFSSGHATNAVGYYIPGLNKCQIVHDGPAGGPGLAGSATSSFTLDREFGLCLEGPTTTFYSNPDLNPGGIEAVRILTDHTASNTFLVGLEDFIDGDFQDLVVRLVRTEDPPIPVGLPDAQPGSTVPWSQVDRDWMLTVVSGPWNRGFQPQGLYLVSPAGERWAVHASVRAAPGDVMGPILDWRFDEALVLVSGPRDLERIVLFDLRHDQSFDITSRAGFTYSPKATFMRANVDGFFTDFTPGSEKRLIQLTTKLTEITSFGPPVPPGTPLHWINAPSGPDFVIASGLDVGESPGQITYVHRTTTDEERIVAFEECTPLRWIRADELAAVCDGVGDTTGLDLWIVPMDGSPMWPVVDPTVTASLGISGFKDMYQSGHRLYLESNAGEIWLLEEGCPVPRRGRHPDDIDRVDLVGAIEDDVFFVHEGLLMRVNINVGSPSVLLEQVGSVARFNNSVPTATGSFPSPPTSGTSAFDTCRKQGAGEGALLTDLRWGLHPTFTRVVFEFEPDETSVPGWWTHYGSGPIQPDNPVGEPIEGDSLLLVQLTPSGTLDISNAPDNVFTYDGPINIDVGVGAVERIDITEDWEGHLGWVITVDDRRPYKVFTLTNPPRLVIDFEHTG